jgi:hypothetical protein
MADEPDWAAVGLELEKLYDASARLGAIFPGRSFTLDVSLRGRPPCGCWAGLVKLCS